MKRKPKKKIALSKCWGWKFDGSDELAYYAYPNLPMACAEFSSASKGKPVRVVILRERDWKRIKERE